MSLLIKGVDMPKNCKRCPCLCDVGAGIYICSAIKDVVEIEDTSKRQSYCAASEIPTPHGRLIDANKLMIAVLEAMNSEKDDSVIGLIEKAPTIIKAEE